MYFLDSLRLLSDNFSGRPNDAASQHAAYVFKDECGVLIF